jgi:hypothetical protein
MAAQDAIKGTKINRLIQTLPRGLVLLSPWLVSEGYSYELQQRYRKSGWFRSIGKGAMLRIGDAFILSGAVSALQTQAQISIHIGGRSALSLHGLSHYLQINPVETTLFIAGKSLLPIWFTNNNWDTEIKLFRVSLFENEEIGLTDYQENELKLKISGAVRAVMECCFLSPNQFPLSELDELIDGLTTLRPAQIQPLLEQCKSVKVKRLFLYFAEKAGHAWFKYIDTTKIDLGAGVRSLAADKGTFVAKYQLVLPKDLSK